jgi:hypothetical protein
MKIKTTYKYESVMIHDSPHTINTDTINYKTKYIHVYHDDAPLVDYNMYKMLCILPFCPNVHIYTILQSI